MKFIWILLAILSVAILPSSAFSSIAVQVTACPSFFSAINNNRSIDRISVKLDGISAQNFYSDYLPEQIRGFKDYFKKILLRHRLAVNYAERLSRARNITGFQSEKGEKMLRVLEPNRKYNFVVLDNQIEIMTTSKNKVEDILSKHYFMANGDGQSDKVRMAGELWKTPDNVLHISNASGTYLPQAKQLKETKTFFEQGLNVPKVETHIHKVPAPVRVFAKTAEVESKLTVPNQATAEQLKQLVGQSIEVIGPDGKPLKIKLVAYKEMKHVDRYFDTADFDLLGKQGMLRERIRFWDKDGANLRDAMYQAKNGATNDPQAESGLFLRDEIRGKAAKAAPDWASYQVQALSEKVPDAAIKYARNLVGNDKPFTPVLEAHDVRFYIWGYKQTLNPINRVAPDFMMTVDQVTYKEAGTGATLGQHIESEVELFARLPLGLQKVTDQRVVILDQVVAFLQKKFGLTISEDSKYGTGMQFHPVKKD